jgi:hypothetical protein
MTIPQRCPACDRYCDGCSLSQTEGHHVRSVEQGHPLDAARGVIYGVLMGAAAWGLFVGFLLLIYFNVHV